MSEEQLKLQISADLDKTGLFEEIESLASSIDEASAKRLMKSVEQSKKVLGVNDSSMGDGGSSGSSKGKGMFSSLKGIFGFVAKIAGVVGLISAAIKVFEPAFKLLGQVADMIAMFLRPINDVVMILLTPILHMVKPLLMVFNTLMMPFKKVAMQGMSAGNQLIGKGMQEMVNGDAALGKDMVSEGMSGVTSSAKLLMVGFMDTLLEPFKNIEFMGIGKAITDGMSNLESDAVKGVMQVMGVVDEVNQLVDGALTQDIFNTISKGVEANIIELEKIVGKFKVDDFDTQFAELKNMNSKTFDAMAEAANRGYTANRIMADLSIGAQNDLITNTVEANKAIKDLSTEISTIKTNSQQVIDDDISNTSFAQKMKGAWNDIWKPLDEMDGEELIIRGLTNPMGAGFIDIAKLTMKYMGNSIIPDEFEKGFEHMNTYTINNMGKKGRITTTFNTGMNNMNINTDKFGSTLKTVSGLLDDATKRMQNYASAYYNAKSKIQRLESSIKNSRGGMF